MCFDGLWAGVLRFNALMDMALGGSPILEPADRSLDELRQLALAAGFSSTPRTQQEAASPPPFSRRSPACFT